ncbi:hypothetical protein ABTD78_23950, partial [Acinetobacter baumannii]
MAGCGSDDDGPPAGGPPGGGGQPLTPAITLTISSREDFPGNFGSVGAYEKLTGSLHGEVDPKDPRNAV